MIVTMPSYRVGLNPLPWVLTAAGFNVSVPVLRQAFAQIATTPFRGIHADPPADLDTDGYRALLADYGLAPAPGYFAASYHQTDHRQIVEDAKLFGAQQAELGNTEAFVAGNLTEARRARPAVGAAFDDGLLQ